MEGVLLPGQLLLSLGCQGRAWHWLNVPVQWGQERQSCCPAFYSALKSLIQSNGSGSFLAGGPVLSLATGQVPSCEGHMPPVKVTCRLFSGSSISPPQVVLRSFKPLTNLLLLYPLPARTQRGFRQFCNIY